ncbi:MAG: caspase family protein [Deltaproteobacteria bacterium]|nr:caspase family protein [Deltaproteobacteria bacterium]
MYQPKYAGSNALIIGINAYQVVGPLGYARQDAEAVAEKLTSRCGFDPARVTLLVDHEATKARILKEFLRFTSDDVDRDDRIFIFFAGHGHTVRGKRGEVGYLVPVDATPGDFGSLIRWDDLTRNADLIRAKHMLFVMDACYGGLAITRTMGAGSMRFLKDMLQRYGRQVLTAGKADEVVSDAGGPIPGHSVFTGHLLQALDGAAATQDGILTANALMAYVYERVAKDIQSRQTPHYGFVDGDGDFILSAPILDALEGTPETDVDILVELPLGGGNMDGTEGQTAVDDLVKEYLSEPRFRIKLDDLVTKEIRKVLLSTSETEFPVQGTQVTPEACIERMERYEAAVGDLQVIAALLSHWGSEEHVPSLQKLISRLSDGHETRNGLVAWLELRWYPSVLMAYSAGIAAVASGNYRNLAAVLLVPVGSRRSGDDTKEAVSCVVEAMLELDRMELFKKMPGHERHYVPRSEYLFKKMQPVLDDLLFLGKSYEASFDRFELIYGLVYADLRGGGWGPLGRFAWKHRSRDGDGPFTALHKEVEAQGEQWAPLRAGLFGRSMDRLQAVLQMYQDFIGRLNWF